jgi:hypothetical protein
MVSMNPSIGSQAEANSTITGPASDMVAHEERLPVGSENARQSGQTSQGGQNVGESERHVSLIAGGLLALLGLSRGSLPGLLVAGVGAALVHRGYSGNCALYSKLGINTNTAGAEHDVGRGI